MNIEATLKPTASNWISLGAGVFMGLPFAGVLWNSQFKAAGNPTITEGV